MEQSQKQAHNLIVTIKPANQRNSLQRRGKADSFGSQSQYIPNQQHKCNSNNYGEESSSKFGNYGPVVIVGGNSGRVYPMGAQGVVISPYQQMGRQSQHSNNTFDDDYDESEDEEEDEIVDHTKTALKIR